MTYYLPPPDEGGSGLHAVSGVHAAQDVARDRGAASPGVADGRIVRLVRMPAGEVAAYLGSWEVEPPPAGAIEAPYGVVARERLRPDRSRPGCVRRQRLAIAAQGGEATALHWSVPEPVTAEDEAVWSRALERLSASGAAAGWRA